MQIARPRLSSASDVPSGSKGAVAPATEVIAGRVRTRRAYNGAESREPIVALIDESLGGANQNGSFDRDRP
jgi:hypothetical protein